MSATMPDIDAGMRRRLTARFGHGVHAWLDELPGRLAALAQRWQLELGAPISRGSMSAVFRCRMADGRPAVLKASPDRARMTFEAAALNAWHTVASPAVIAVDEGVAALLIEAIEPGTPLVVSSSHPTPEAIADLLQALHGGVADPTFPAVTHRIDHLFNASERLYERHLELAALVPRALHDRGRHHANRLARHDLPVVLLHGDLTPSNILDGGSERGLVAIDPAPCLGDAAFDAVDLIFWEATSLDAIETCAQRLAAAAGLDAQRLLDWCEAFAAMCALELASEGEAGRPRFEALLELASDRCGEG